MSDVGPVKQMSLDINSVVSLISLIVALGTAFAAHHYFKRAEKQRDEDLIQNALGAFSRYRAVAATLKRVRGNTGVSLNEEELSMFGKLDYFTTESEVLEKELVEILSSRKLLTPEMRRATLTSVALTERFSTTLQSVSDRLQNQNTNNLQRLQELQEHMGKLEKLLRIYSNKS